LSWFSPGKDIKIGSAVHEIKLNGAPQQLQFYTGYFTGQAFFVHRTKMS
jgi:hypothetical protein